MLSAPVVHLVNVAEGVSDNVAVKPDIGASLVGMEAVDPAAAVYPFGSLTINIDIVSVKLRISGVIRAAGGAVALLAQRIDTAAVLQHRGVILDTVVVYMVVSGGGGGDARKLAVASAFTIKVAPAPADAHTAVRAFVNKVVLNPHILGVERGNRGVAREEIAVFRQIVISDINIFRNRFCSLRELLFIGTDVRALYLMLRSVVFINVLGMPDYDACSSGMSHNVSCDIDVIHVIFHVESQIAGHFNLAVQNGDVVGGGRVNGRRRNIIGTVHLVVPVAVAELIHNRGGLHRSVTVGAVHLFQVPVGISESQAPEGDIGCIILFGSRARDIHQGFHLGDNNFRIRHIFSLFWDIVQRAACLIEVKLARVGQELEHVPHPLLAARIVIAVPARLLGDCRVGHLEIHLDVAVIVCLQASGCNNGLYPFRAGFQFNILRVSGVRGKPGILCEDVVLFRGTALPGPVRLALCHLIAAAGALGANGSLSHTGALAIDINRSELIIANQLSLISLNSVVKPIHFCGFLPVTLQELTAADDRFFPVNSFIVDCAVLVTRVVFIKNNGIL